MAKIKLTGPQNPYSAEIDTGAMAVEIKDAFVGVKFVTGDGEILRVSMRDGGFEISYASGFGELGVLNPTMQLHGGHVRLVKDEPRAEITADMR